MKLNANALYHALRARDARFDGVFYVGVKTTGVYCRPICPARLPGRERCEFFPTAAAAEHAGYRACFRCRPELAPGQAAVDSPSRLARTAAARINCGYLNEHSIDELAAALSVTARHLRRVLESEAGVSPVELAQTRRLALAKQLLQDTSMALADIAFAAGFASVRRFNALFRQRFGRPPSVLRREHGAGHEAEFITLRLDYRPPFAWDALLAFLDRRAIPGVERVEGGEYRRTAALGDHVGWIAVRPWPGRSALRARVSHSLAPKLMEIAARLRGLFDLDARPDVIDSVLRRDPLLRRGVDARPGLRVPGAFDGFELAVRAVLGQQVSVAAATTLSGRLVERFGSEAPSGLDGVERAFPTPAVLARIAIAELSAVGVPRSRALTIVELSRAVEEGRIDLSGGDDPEGIIAALQSLQGVGPWTAHYLAMRALRWPDAFPAGDRGIRMAFGVSTDRAAEARAEAWRPWRAYGAMRLWGTLAKGG